MRSALPAEPILAGVARIAIVGLLPALPILARAGRGEPGAGAETWAAWFALVWLGATLVSCVDRVAMTCDGTRGRLEDVLGLVVPFLAPAALVQSWRVANLDLGTDPGPVLVLGLIGLALTVSFGIARCAERRLDICAASGTIGAPSVSRPPRPSAAGAPPLVPADARSAASSDRAKGPAVGEDREGGTDTRADPRGRDGPVP